MLRLLFSQHAEQPKGYFSSRFAYARQVGEDAARDKMDTAAQAACDRVIRQAIKTAVVPDAMKVPGRVVRGRRSSVMRCVNGKPLNGQGCESAPSSKKSGSGSIT